MRGANSKRGAYLKLGANSSIYGIQTDQKTIGPFVLTRDPKTEAQQISIEVETDNCTPRNFKRCIGISNPIPLCSCSTSHSSHKMFGFNSSSKRCRSAEAPIIEDNKENTLYKGRFLQQTVLGPQKRRDSSSCNLPEPSQQVYRKLQLPNGKHLLLKDPPKKGDFLTCVDLKDAYLSVHVYESSQKYLYVQWKCNTNNTASVRITLLN